jgi:hypothetical protein
MVSLSRKFVSFLALVAILATCGCVREDRLRYRDDLVEVRELSKVNMLSVHSSRSSEALFIWGKRFTGVRGRNPCCLRIPGKPLILFVTGRTWDHGQAVVHLANTESRTIQDFPAYDSSIGANIGDPKPDYFERVQSVNGDELVIVAGFLDRRFRYVINLKSPSFVREEGDFLSGISKKREHYIYEEGRAPKA